MLNKEIYELTNPQKSIWLTEQYYNNTNINNICGSANINQELNFEKLKEAINIMIKNNDSFNLRFIVNDNTLKQYLDEYPNHQTSKFRMATQALIWETIRGVNVEFYTEKNGGGSIVDVSNERELQRLEKEVCDKIFRIEKSKLFEFVIFRFPNNHGGFIMNIHHLLSDSWTHGLACKEVVRIYNKIIKSV